MNLFPQHHELIWLFESEPRLLDADLPWFYNRLTFEVQKDEDLLSCVLEPAENALTLIWSSRGNEILRLETCRIERLQVKKHESQEWLEAGFGDENGLLPLVIQLKPHICVSWGNLPND